MPGAGTDTTAHEGSGSCAHCCADACAHQGAH